MPEERDTASTSDFLSVTEIPTFDKLNELNNTYASYSTGKLQRKASSD